MKEINKNTDDHFTQFFMYMDPPTVTAQEHKVMVRNGRPVFFDPPELKDARAKLMVAAPSKAALHPWDPSVCQMAVPAGGGSQGRRVPDH